MPTEEFTGEEPDVDPATGDERKTDPDEGELSQAEIDCDPNTDTDDLNHRYDPVD